MISRRPVAVSQSGGGSTVCGWGEISWFLGMLNLVRSIGPGSVGLQIHLIPGHTDLVCSFVSKVIFTRNMSPIQASRNEMSLPVKHQICAKRFQENIWILTLIFSKWINVLPSGVQLSTYVSWYGLLSCVTGIITYTVNRGLVLNMRSRSLSSQNLIKTYKPQWKF